MSNKKNRKRIGYIYKIINDVNDKVYIGQTITSLKKRFGDHCSDARNNKSKMLIHVAMRKHGIENFHIVEVERVEADTREELLEKLNEKEIYYIEYFQSLKHLNGYNLTIGGNNYSKYNRIETWAYDKHTKELVCETDSINEMSRLFNYDATSIKDSCDGKTVPIIDYVFRYKGDAFDKYATEFHVWNERPVYQFTLDGVFVAIYCSAVEAERITGISCAGIRNVLIKQNKSCMGFYWTYQDYFDFEDYIDIRVAIDKYTLDGKFVTTYMSIMDGIRDTGLDISQRTAIVSCCKGKINYAYGFVWRYHGDPFDLYEWRTHKKKVDMYKDGIFIRSYDSITEAADNIGADKANVSACCLGKVNTVLGYVFRFSGDAVDKYTKYKIRQKDKDGNEIAKYTSINKGSANTGIKPYAIQRILKGNVYDTDEFLWEYIA